MIILSILAGLSAGALHVLCGPDHLAAIAPLSADRGRKAASIGLRWGIGHSGGVIFVGLVALLLRGLFNIEAFAAAAEGGAAYPIPASEMTHNIAVLEAITDSAESGKSMTLADA